MKEVKENLAKLKKAYHTGQKLRSNSKLTEKGRERLAEHQAKVSKDMKRNQWLLKQRYPWN